MNKWQKNCKELKINLETFTKCGGSCQGCMLSKNERTNGTIWTEKQFDILKPKIQDIISEYSKTEDFFEISLNFAPADHFLTPLDRIDGIVKWMKEVGLGKACGFITASAVGKTDIIKKNIDAWRNAMDKYNQPICIDLVFEPSKIHLENFEKIYTQNIEYIHKVFGGVDLNINIGPDTIEAISPKELHALMRKNKFKNLTLNLIPTFETAQKFAQNWDNIIQWMNEVLFSWEKTDVHGYNPCSAIAPYIESIPSYNEINNPSLILIEQIKNKAKSEFYIDNNGQFYFSQAGFGDVAQSYRFGFNHINFSYENKNEIIPILERKAQEFATQNVKNFYNKQCIGCKYNVVCPRISMNVLKKTVQPHFDQKTISNCPLKIKSLFESIEKYISIERDMTEYNQQRTQFNIPSGLDDNLLPHTKSMNTYNEDVKLK